MFILSFVSMPGKRFLIIRFSSMGDIVLTTPVIRCLKKAYPDAEIHYLTKPGFASILKDNPYISTVWEWQEDSKSLLNELKTLHFDQVIDLHHNLRSWRVKIALGRPSQSFNKLNIEKYLWVRFRINRLPKLHIVDRYLETLRSLDVKNDFEGLDYFIPACDEIALRSLPEPFNQGYIALVAGALKGTKRMPDAQLLQICRGLNQAVIVLGGKAEMQTGEFLEQEGNGRVLNRCGMLNLNGSASLIRQSRSVISHDTGLMHIAAAFKKPIVSIWGNTIPEFGMTPYYPKLDVAEYRAEVKDLTCRPCSKIGFDRCPKGHFSCMVKQDIPEIVSQALEMSK